MKLDLNDRREKESRINLFKNMPQSLESWLLKKNNTAYMKVKNK